MKEEIIITKKVFVDSEIPGVYKEEILKIEKSNDTFSKSFKEWVWDEESIDLDDY